MQQLIWIGCATYGIGASVASSGGDTEFQFGPAKMVMKTHSRKHQQSAPNVVLSNSNKIPMCWTHGSALRSGLSHSWLARRQPGPERVLSNDGSIHSQRNYQ